MLVKHKLISKLIAKMNFLTKFKQQLMFYAEEWILKDVIINGDLIRM